MDINKISYCCSKNVRNNGEQMTIQKRLMISNFAANMITALMIFIVSVAYVFFFSEAAFNKGSGSAGGIDRLTKRTNILYIFEEEISEMKWQAVLPEGGKETEITLLPEAQRIEELKALGYHIQVRSPYGVSFTNMEPADEGMLARAGNVTENFSYVTDKELVVGEKISYADRDYYVTAVYSEDRVDAGVERSMTPLYMVPKGIGIGFFLITVVCITAVSSAFSRMTARAVLVPLRQLKKGAKLVAEGDLNYRISYKERDEYGEVCEEFDVMRRQLKEAFTRQKRDEQQQRELLRGITHDLRSPLTSIKGYAMGIKDGIANTPEKRTRYCDAILTRAEDLERLTGSLSIFLKMDAENGFLHPEKVNLDEYIRQFLAEKKAWLADRKVEVIYKTQDPNAEAALDIREMQRVFMNLLENTVRYRTSDRSKVEIEVRQNPQGVEILFSDDGPGVGEEHLFDSFYRADQSRTSPEKGSGIGLAIVRRIIEGQGGQVEASSDGGLCITMALPSARREEKA